MLIKQHKESEYSSKPIQNGVFTLSWARYHMKLLWDASTRPDTECVYSDIDNIFVRKEQFNLNSKFELDRKHTSVIGTDVGQLDNALCKTTLGRLDIEQEIDYYIKDSLEFE